ncbi:MAG TPA: STAS domain-containing protein [Solirubrobacteraceae bacterium]|nr:STAS domain-containing protein [Solirubrobacteraceae bacterium]
MRPSFDPSHVDTTVEGAEARAALSGDFDMNATFTVEPVLERLLDKPGLERLTVDLSGLSFIDSTGLGVLVRMQTETRQRGLDYALVPGPPDVQRVFDTAGLTGSLPFTDPGHEQPAA